MNHERMKIKIRKLKEEDFKKGYFETLSNLTTVNLTYSRAKRIYKKIKNNPVYQIFVAELEGRIVGAITLLVEQKFIHSAGKVGHIEDVVVRKGFEGKGIGSVLVKTAIKKAKNEGCYKIILDCAKKNTPFYKKLGFRVRETEMRLDL